MKLYLMRHGEALNPIIDPKEPLSKGGCKDVQRLAYFLNSAGVSLIQIYHSDKLRAKQTAEIMKIIGQSIQLMDNLFDKEQVKAVCDELGSMMNDTLIVGHAPLLVPLLSKLVTGDESYTLVKFHPATLVCLEREQSDKWVINYVLCSDVIK